MKKPEDLPQEYQDILKQIGAKLQSIRKKQKKSYKDLAQEVGLQRNLYNRLENGKINFQISTLLQILSYHNISLTDFFHDPDYFKDSSKS